MNSDIVTLCKAIAHRAHAGQFRRDGVTPYIVHPEAVARRLEGDPAAQATAWLHDVLEDTAVTEADLESAGVSRPIVDAVRLLTKVDGADYEAYLREIRNHPLARKVKVADMLANLGDAPSERQILKYARGLIVLLAPS